jgi:predicted protein tyrosine phosphatase
MPREKRQRAMSRRLPLAAARLQEAPQPSASQLEQAAVMFWAELVVVMPRDARRPLEARSELATATWQERLVAMPRDARRPLEARPWQAAMAAEPLEKPQRPVSRLERAPVMRRLAAVPRRERAPLMLWAELVVMMSRNARRPLGARPWQEGIAGVALERQQAVSRPPPLAAVISQNARQLSVLRHARQPSVLRHAPQIVSSDERLGAVS